MKKSTKTLLIIAAVIVGLIIVLFAIRLFSGEDDWICQNGQWIEHGHPSAPAPTKPCQ